MGGIFLLREPGNAILQGMFGGIDVSGKVAARPDKEALMMAALLLFMLLIITALAGVPLLQASPFNSYTLQAMAWRSGRTALTQDIPHLELAVYQGKYFVSFPPVPSVPIYALSFLFGASVPDGLLVKLYALIAFFALYRLLRRAFLKPWPAALAAFLMCAASSMLPMLLSGAVWYQAQVMAFMFTCLALDNVYARRPTRGLFYYALSVGCRPFNALFGLLLIILSLQLNPGRTCVLKHKLKALLPGILLGLSVAVIYGWYNYIRFADPFEFGHNYLPEFSSQGGQQFALWHIPKNAPTFIWGLPFEWTEGKLLLKKFGFSLFLANPVLLLFMLWGLRDMMHKKMSALKALTYGLCLLHMLLLLSHRTFGGFQYGARYGVDLIPYAALYLVQSERTPEITKGFFLAMLPGLIMSVWGSLTIVLPT